MKFSKLRRRIALIAAHLISERHEWNFYRARIQAARLVSKDRVRGVDLPTNDEIRAELRALAVASDRDRFNGEQGNDVRGEPVLADEHPHTDRFRVYRSLLHQLENVKQSPRSHPEGDALYHSLQVFQLARDHVPYDEEFLLAALLHDVGKAIDRHDHVTAGLDVLDGTVTPRTVWFIEFHPHAQLQRQGTLGARAIRRLHESEDYDQLLLLAQCDREGRRTGVAVPDVDDAIDYIRQLEKSFG